MAISIGWELYRSFLGVCNEGSLSGAARTLGLTQPTVGRHIAALEQALQVPLFTRSPSGLSPTEAAVALQPHAQAMHAEAEALRRVAESQAQGVQGTVRVTASQVVGVEVLPPILAALQARHPGLRIELAVTDRVQNLLRREADIAVRMGRPDQGQLIARRLGNFELGLFAHRDYLARRGVPRSVDELAAHSLIGFDEETPFLRAAQKAWPAWRREAFVLRCDSDLAQLAMIRAGGGIGICQAALARRTPELVRLLPRQVRLPLDSWLTMHEDQRGTPRCKVAFDALREGLGRYLSNPG